MNQKKYRVTLTTEERTRLEDLVNKGTAAARKLTHARILLKADASAGGPAWTDEQIRVALDVGLLTIYRTRLSFVEEGLAAALGPRPSARRYQRKFDGESEAHLIALACSKPPPGFARWTVRLLRDRFVALANAPRVSYETVRQTLKKTRSGRTC
jgi:hypothetical protein